MQNFNWLPNGYVVAPSLGRGLIIRIYRAFEQLAGCHIELFRAENAPVDGQNQFVVFDSQCSFTVKPLVESSIEFSGQTSLPSH